MRKNQLDVNQVRAIFIYDNGELLWNISRNNSISIGDVAGYIDKGLYKRLEYNGKSYYCHVLIWNYFNGLIPDDMTVDHKIAIRKGGTNHIENLQLLSMQNNIIRRNMQTNNKTGFRGVSFCNKRQKYVAQLMFNKKNYNLGAYHSPEEAALAYNTKAAEIFGEYATFNVLHPS